MAHFAKLGPGNVVEQEDTCQWKAPVDMPTDGQMYSWDEATTSWIATEV